MTTPPTQSEANGTAETFEITLENAVQTIVEKGFTDYLVDTEYVDELAIYLRDEVRIPTAVTKLVLKTMLPLALKQAKPAASWVGKAGGRIIAQRLKSLPGVERVLKAVTHALEKFDAEAAARRRFDELLEARRAGRPNSIETDEERGSDNSGLSRDLKADLEILATVDTLGNEFAKLAEVVESLTRQLTPQPPLRLRRVPLSERTRFVYGARSTRLVGREEEMAALEAFLDAPKMLCWWVVTGSGGMGKSRIALELALRFGTAARVGFLRWPWTVAWDTWQPDRPTVIVVDYAEGLSDAVRDALVRLAERDDLAFPIRVLLLARHVADDQKRLSTSTVSSEARSSWLERVLGVGSTRALLEQSLYAAPLELRPLDDAALKAVMESFVPPHLMAAVDTTVVRALTDLDPQRRPLFAAFAGDAVGRGQVIRQWSRTDLLENVRREEQEFWTRAEVTEAERDLLMLATMTGGLEVADLSGPDARAVDVEIDAIDPKRYRTMTGVAADRHFAPLEPDILGEYFVLERLKARGPEDWRAWRALRRAGDISTKGAGGFLERAAADFPEHETVLRWLARPPEGVANGPQVASVLAMLGNGFMLADNLPGLRAAHGAITALMAEEPGYKVARQVGAVIAGNLSLAAGKANQIAEAERAYHDVAALSDAQLSNQELRQFRAMVAGDLVIDLTQAGDTAGMRRLLNEYASLCDAHPSDVVLREVWSRAAYQYLHVVGGRKQFATARPVAQALYRMAATFGFEPRVRQRAARAARNLLWDYIGSARAPFAGADIEGAAAQYRQVRTLASNHPHDHEIRQQYILAAEHVHDLYKHRRDQRRAAQIIDDAKRLGMAW